MTQKTLVAENREVKKRKRHNKKSFTVTLTWPVWLSVDRLLRRDTECKKERKKRELNFSGHESVRESTQRQADNI